MIKHIKNSLYFYDLKMSEESLFSGFKLINDMIAYTTQSIRAQNYFIYKISMPKPDHECQQFGIVKIRFDLIKLKEPTIEISKEIDFFIEKVKGMIRK